MRTFRTAVVSASFSTREGLPHILDSAGFQTVRRSARVQDLGLREEPAQLGDLDGVDLFLVEVAPPPARAYGDLERIRGCHPTSRIAALLTRTDTELIRACFEGPADALLSVSASSEVLIAVLNLTMTGERFVAERFIPKLIASPCAPETLSDAPEVRMGVHLSDRQVEIVQCIVEGMNNKEIARQLDIAESTVKVHCKSIMRKLRARNRTEIAVWAVQTVV